MRTWGHMFTRVQAVGVSSPARCSITSRYCLTHSALGEGFRCLTTSFNTPKSTFQDNLTSLTNQMNRNDDFMKFEHKKIPRGIPRLSRLEVRPISVIHETPRVSVVGRNFANGFRSNQFLLLHRASKECMFVDAVDDWPDDWVDFIEASQLTPTHIFLTHCHMDNLLCLSTLLHRMKLRLGMDVGIMWNQSEKVWAEKFGKACERYHRTDLAEEADVLLRETNHYTAYYPPPPSSPRGGPLIGHRSKQLPPHENPNPPPLISRPNDMLLSSASSRSCGFYEFGPHTPLHFVFTPGHSPGHKQLSVARERLLFTGDLLYYNGVGRVDLPYASSERLGESLLALQDFPDETVLLPGHGRLTTLGRERRHNTALRYLYTRKTDQPQKSIPVGFNAGYL